jgi:putative ABC transport system permease protein
VSGLRTVREYASSVVVAGLGTLFGAVMLIAAGVLASVLEASGADGFRSVQAVLNVIGFLFLGIALYVSAVVTANTCSTVIAGQTRVIALQRLIGASGSMLRGRITRTGLLVGAVGAVLGTLAAMLLTAAVVGVLRADGTLPDAHYTFVMPTLLVPMVAVVLTTWAAFGAGSRRVLSVRPLEALSSTVEPRPEDTGSSRARSVGAIVLVVIGVALLVLGMLGAHVSSYLVLVAMLGGFVSFTGVAVGATLFVPPILALIGRIGAGNPAVLLSGRNALRAPGRSSRATIGLVIGTTLLVTFSVALATYQQQVLAAYRVPATVAAQTDSAFGVVNGIASSLAGFSGVIAAVGVVNALALGVLQRRREVGLLRAIGFSAVQVRTMIVVEAVQMVVTALAVGLVLGTFYGWAGAVSLFGSGATGAILPVLPLTTVGIVVVGGLLLAVIASIAPVRRVTSVAPTEALAVE